jgi:F-type H+-transporting ATPase subunit epsilon
LADRKKFDVSLVTPDGPAYEGEAELIIVPGQAGEIGIMARHAPIIATVNAGSIRVYLDWDADDMREFASGPGFFQMLEDRAIVLVDDAVMAREIDHERAQRQLDEAQAELERVDRGESNADRWQLEQRIRHAENQLTVAGRS